MKARTVTEVARNFSAVLDELERDGEEIVLVRNHRQIARLIPESAPQTAIEVLGDLYRILDDKAADALGQAISRTRKRKSTSLKSLWNRWAS